ncbi:hypothetical protein [Mitsuaria sp. 7]|uniref:hypothetical protein n=1 Tax=Mitsuaria sp. 7 TaxID=1658665 RepID=UPI0007DD1A69|nr:hypothetical protein [Mitsuaria sp. 7]ANH67490.1 hypothetical protein ABE85_07755 [Mitsuaria sp. 7]
MNLRDILLHPADLHEDAVVYARRPWSLMSEAITLRRPGTSATLNPALKGTGLEYFLEAFLITEIYEDLLMQGKTGLEAAEVVLYYAENDAYPE